MRADDLVAVIGGSGFLSHVLMAESASMLEARRVSLAMTTPEGQAVLGSVAAVDRPAVRLAADTHLPWTIQVWTSAEASADGRPRRRLLIVGMVVLFSLIAAGGWFVERTVARELALADLQSGFVSAVSHEFRTPLTTLCQLSELLMRNRVASDDDRRHYYVLLNQESHRLRRLVESLLNFGSLEAGRMQFRFEPIDAAALVRQASHEFSCSEQATGHRVELSVSTEPALVSADRDMLRTVVWNVLENAAKYSPGRETVWADLRRVNGHVTIAVRDEGVGIPRDEQKDIFEPFVRGSDARSREIRGTGVGLAMARQILAAHGGTIGVESEHGRGSTFTIVLPAQEA